MSTEIVKQYPSRGYAPEGYALSGKIMLSAIIILFTVVILIICFHIYARWFLSRHRSQQNNLNRRRGRRRRTRRTHFVFNTSNPNSNDTVLTMSRGLDSTVIKSIPTFVYSSNTHDSDLIECSVCLSEFEENEKGRTLPKCNHSFHIECIDMWFHSHSTCPLCRSPVNLDIISESGGSEINHNHQIQIIIDPVDSEPGSTSNMSSINEGVEIESGFGSSSSFTSSLSVDVRKTEENLKILEGEIQESPGNQGLKSPGSRILSLKRILSREKKVGSMSRSLSFCGNVAEIDPEKGKEEEEEIQVHVHVQQQR